MAYLEENVYKLGNIQTGVTGWYSSGNDGVRGEVENTKVYFSQ